MTPRENMYARDRGSKFVVGAGKNPFADPTCQPHEVGTYEVHVR